MKKQYLTGAVILLLLCGGCTDTGVPMPEPTATEVPGEAPTEAPTAIPLDGLSNDCRGWGFRRMPGRPEFTARQREEMETYRCIYMGSEEEKRLYLTFDEGYENGYTPMILDVLQKTATPAAFFITGAYLEREPELVCRMVAEGHTVGNHSMNHPGLPSIGDNEAAAQEITMLAERFSALTGQEMTYFRPPRGEYSPRTLAIADNLGYTNVFWSLAYRDWDTDAQRGAEHAYREVTGQLHPGCVILLHAVSRDNAEALERIINDAKAQGYTFCPLSEFR